VQLSLGDFVAARRSLKKALQLGSQQPLDGLAVKKAFKYGERAAFNPFHLVFFLDLFKMAALMTPFVLPISQLTGAVN